MTSEWLPRSAPPSPPPSCPSGWVSSQTGVIELAVTDSAALTRTGWREPWSGLTERYTASGYSLYFCKCRWFLVLNNVLSAGCYLQGAEIEMYCYKKVLTVLIFLLRVATFNDKYSQYEQVFFPAWSVIWQTFFFLSSNYFVTHLLWHPRWPEHRGFFLFSPREQTLFTEHLHLSFSLSPTP